MKINILVLLFFISIVGKSQLNEGFLKHLYLNDLHKEHLTYLELQEEASGLTDSLRLYRVKYFLSISNLNSAHKEMLSCNSCYLDSSLVNYASAKFFRNSIKQAKSIWKTDSILGRGTSNSLLFRSHQLTLNKSLSSDFLPSNLKTHYNEFLSVQKKKGWVAGTLSLIPGVGKLYIGRYNSFWGSFFINTLYGITAYESISNNGWKNGYTIFTAGVFTTFYVSNIFGTIHDLKRVKNEKRKHFLYEVADYQSAGYTLYP